MMLYLALYGLLGIVAGLLAGLLGVGGGLIIVPALSLLYEAQGFSPDATLHLALGTSLGTIIFTSMSSTRAHYRAGSVDTGIVKRITPGILLGTFLGGWGASRMPTVGLKLVFALFLIGVALQMLTGARPRPTRVFPKAIGATTAGLVIGGLSGMVGIGGGSMSVPFMVWCNVAVRRAVGTSAAIGFPIAVAGALSYVVNGMGANTGVAYTFGYLHVPALLGVAVTSVLTAPIGARMTKLVDPARIKQGFACLLLVMSAKLLWGILVR